MAMAKRPTIRGHETARAVPEWIGKTPDSAIPDVVKLRIWFREGGRCHVTGAIIRPGDKFDYEHVIALINGGENRESNIALVLRGKAHKAKTAQDRKERARGDKAVKRLMGIGQSKRPLPCGKGSPYKKKPGDHRLYWRDSGEPVR